MKVVEGDTLHVLLLVVLVLKKSYANAGMPECWRKVSPVSAILPTVNFSTPASAFIGTIPASGSVRSRWSRIHPALPSHDRIIEGLVILVITMPICPHY
jgi:hypothetical protein